MADVIRLPVASSLSIRSSSPMAPVASILNPLQLSRPPNHLNLEKKLRPLLCSASSSSSSSSSLFGRVNFLSVPQEKSVSFKVRAAIAETEQPKWWEKNAGPNMIDIHSTEEFLKALSDAGDRLVIVEFYGTWCASCRALFPKLCRTAEDHPDIVFLKVNFDENKPMCKSLNVKVLPYFHFYRGSDGQLESFSCSLAKFQKIKDAIQLHNTARCSIGPAKAAGETTLESLSAQIANQKPA